MSKFVVEHQSPSLIEFAELRATAGWPNAAAKIMQSGLDNSLFNVTVRLKAEQLLVAMGRVIGDGALYFYIQDVVVRPEFQGTGIGSLVMKEIEHYLESTARSGATVGLFAVKGKEKFYARYGYTERTGAPLGLGMCKFF